MRTISVCALAAGLALASLSSVAGNGIDPATITYKEWDAAKPKTMVILPRRPQVNKAVQLFGGWKGRFEWSGSEEMTQIGNDLYKRNNFDLAEGRVHTTVTELYLGGADGLLKVLRPTFAHYQWLSAEDLRSIPVGAKKVLYVTTRNSAGMASQGIEAIVIAFDESSDADMRRIAYEEAVLRELRYRED
ncbi:MAG: hypothetical protein NT159_07680 [Proteobacteria bacterium]|nr:hypothetical protein [Pseudomonadota bacterium]